MVRVVGPAFSLSATGTIGNAIFYYDSRYGAMVRGPRKKRPESVAQIFTLNQTWFKAASNRAKTLNDFQKEAWRKVYPKICRSWRDIFMGKQIEAWNAWAGNDLTWPQITIVKEAPYWKDPIYSEGSGAPNQVRWGLSQLWFPQMQKFGVSTLWFRVLNNPAQPAISTALSETDAYDYIFSLVPGNTNYLWGGVRLYNGTVKMTFLKSYVV